MRYSHLTLTQIQHGIKIPSGFSGSLNLTSELSHPKLQACDGLFPIPLFIETIYIFSVFLQIFFYNVHMLPSDLFDKHISFRVSTHMSILKLHLLSVCIATLTVSCARSSAGV